MSSIIILPILGSKHEALFQLYFLSPDMICMNNILYPGFVYSCHFWSLIQYSFGQPRKRELPDSDFIYEFQNLLNEKVDGTPLMFYAFCF